MLQKILVIFEWAIGAIASGGAFLSVLFVMFSDSPSFESKLTPLQKIFFNTEGYWLMFIIGEYILSCVPVFNRLLIFFRLIKLHACHWYVT